MAYTANLNITELNTLRNQAQKLLTASQQYAQGSLAVASDATDALEAALDALIDAIAVAVSGTIVANGEVLTGVTPTGTFATTVTFTVANGAITAIALA